MQDSAPLDLQLRPGRFADLVGYRLLAWEPERAVLALLLEERHLNRSGLMHGGVLTTLIDAACGYAGTHCSLAGNVRGALTLQLSTQFIAAGRAGQRLTATGRKTGGGRSVFFATAEVADEAGRLIGRGEGVFRYRRGSESPEGLPPAGLPADPSTSRRD